MIQPLPSTRSYRFSHLSRLFPASVHRTSNLHFRSKPNQRSKLQINADSKNHAQNLPTVFDRSSMNFLSIFDRIFIVNLSKLKHEAIFRIFLSTKETMMQRFLNIYENIQIFFDDFFLLLKGDKKDDRKAPKTRFSFSSPSE
jgi:hypothetical protein